MRDPRVPSKALLRRGEAHVVGYQLQDDANTLALEGRARHRIEVDRAAVNSASQCAHSVSLARGRVPVGSSARWDSSGAQATRFTKPREKLVVQAGYRPRATQRGQRPPW
jgi:hypothetical protein